MTCRTPALTVSAFSIAVLSLGSLAPALAQTSGTAPAASIGSGTDSPSHSHNDSTGLILLGVVAGGAALLGGGSHGQGSASPAPSGLTPAIAGPQVVWTQAATNTAASAAPAVIAAPHPNILLETPALSMVPASPGIVFTSPAVGSLLPLTVPVAASLLPLTVPVAASPTSLSLALPVTLSAAPVTLARQAALTPGSGLSVAPPVAAVPEPAPTATFALGSLLLGGLLFRAGRNSVI